MPPMPPVRTALTPKAAKSTRTVMAASPRTALQPDLYVVIDTTNTIPVFNRSNLQCVVKAPHAVVIWPTNFPHWQAQYSPDLTNWTVLEEGESLDPSLLHVFVDFDVTRVWDRRFYRMIPMP